MVKDTVTGELLDEEYELTLNELCRACSVQTHWIIELVDEGILEPRGTDMEHWQFTGVSLHRVRTARRLQHDLGVNVAGIALVMQLMEEVRELRYRISMLHPVDQ